MRVGGLVVEAVIFVLVVMVIGVALGLCFSGCLWGYDNELFHFFLRLFLCCVVAYKYIIFAASLYPLVCFSGSCYYICCGVLWHGLY